jgi:hypothetical protein
VNNQNEDDDEGYKSCEDDDQDYLVYHAMKIKDQCIKEINEYNPVIYKVYARLFQAEGNLTIYDASIDNNVDIQKDVFLCLDQIDNFKYMLNVIDKTGSKSYTRKILNTVDDI